MIKLENIIKIYNKNKDNQINVLNDITIAFNDSGLVAILGRSGCGKTTLLNILGGLDCADKGIVTIGDFKTDSYKSKLWDKVRSKDIGYIFQNYYLFNDKTVYENLETMLNIAGLFDKEEIDKRIDNALALVGLRKYKLRKPSTLSGGQQQRVGIARAIIKNPKLLLADEPTGNLDSKNTLEIMKILKEISKTCLVVLVTHEEKLANQYADRIIKMRDGFVVEDKDNTSEFEAEKEENTTKVEIIENSLKKPLTIDKKPLIIIYPALKKAIKRYFNEPIKKKLKSHILLFLCSLMLVFSLAISYKGLVFDKSSYQRDTRILEISMNTNHKGKEVQDLIGQCGIESIHLQGAISLNSLQDVFYFYSIGHNFFDIYSNSKLSNPKLLIGDKANPGVGEAVLNIRLANNIMEYLNYSGITRTDFLIGETINLNTEKKFKIVGIIDGYEYSGAFINSNDYENIMNDFKESSFYVISNDKKATIDKLMPLSNQMQDPYQQVLKDFNDQYTLSAYFGFTFALIVLLVAVSVIRRKIKAGFILRIKEIGILRCIGANKSEVSMENIFESLITCTLSSFLGFLLTSYIIFQFDKAYKAMGEAIFYYPWWLMILTGLLLYAVHMLFTLVSLNSLLKKTPTEIMTKFDI